MLLQEIETASEVYEYFIKEKERAQFGVVLKQLRNLFKTHLPNSLTSANVMYPGEQRTPQQAKGELKAKIEELNEWCRKESSVYKTIKDKRTLDLLLAGHKTKLQGRCQLLNLDFNLYSKGFDFEYNKRLEIITGDKK